MTDLINRVRRLEQVAEVREGRVVVILKQFGESEEDALVLYPGIDREKDLIIFINRFSSPSEPSGNIVASKETTEPPSEINSEIESIVSDLQGEGFTLEEIAGMVKGEVPIPENEPAMEPPPSLNHDEPLQVEPMKADDLSLLFRRRGFPR